METQLTNVIKCENDLLSNLIEIPDLFMAYQRLTFTLSQVITVYLACFDFRVGKNHPNWKTSFVSQAYMFNKINSFGLQMQKSSNRCKKINQIIIENTRENRIQGTLQSQVLDFTNSCKNRRVEYLHFLINVNIY